MSMAISGSYGNYGNTGSMGVSQGTDSVSKNIQNQILMKQQELQRLSENEDMSPEDKMKKRQEINQEISNLNMQLRQHQMEMRREQQQKAGSSMEEMLGSRQEADNQLKGENTGLSQGSMQALISADSAMGQAKAQGSVATKLEGAARTLSGEIKLDKARVEYKAIQGANTETKESQLSEMEQRVMQAKYSQINELKKADEEIEEAAKEENGAVDKEPADNKEEKNAGKVTGLETETGSGEAVDKRASYTPVDIRL